MEYTFMMDKVAPVIFINGEKLAIIACTISYTTKTDIPGQGKYCALATGYLPGSTVKKTYRIDFRTQKIIEIKGNIHE